MFFKKKELSLLDIKSIVLIIENYNNTHTHLELKHKEYFLSETLRQFGVKVEQGRIPAPPRQGCYSPTNDVTTKPPSAE